jgi:sterol desaturase/sphingolipid hydroxylase (fatty acid hydroxylase superfamily)
MAALVVDPREVFVFALLASALFLISAAVGPARDGATLPWLVDPTGRFSVSLWIIGYVLSVPGKIYFWDRIVVELTRFWNPPRMDEGGSKKRLERFETDDYICFSINSVIEWSGFLHIVAYNICDRAEQSLKGVTVTNTVLAFLFCVLANELIYWFMHMVAHHPVVYPYVHRHHHKQFVPFRGFLDGVNTHPLEHVMGFTLIVCSLQITSFVIGCHACTGWAMFVIWAFCETANHLGVDSHMHIPVPYPAYPHDHQMHHRFPRCNFATMSTLWDRLFKTFRPFESLTAVGGTKSFEPAPLGRPEILPSGASVVFTMSILLVSAIYTDSSKRGAFPPLEDIVYLLNPLLVVLAWATLCQLAAYTSTLDQKMVSPAKAALFAATS